MRLHNYKPGDLVMFANRCQSCEGGMRVQDVDTNMFNTLLKVEDKWWTPGCFITFDEWRRK